jgi:ElaB/YqjD/DUF883 family membrane-anchored ribosome-binding protein
MNTQPSSDTTSSNPDARSARADERPPIVGHTQGAAGSVIGTVSNELQALTSRARDLPQMLEQQLKDNPYAVLGVTAGVGFGLGMIVSSRVTRMLLLSVGGYALNEVLKARVKKYLDGALT